MIGNSEGNRLDNFLKLVSKDNSGSDSDIAPAVVEESTGVNAVKKKGFLRAVRLVGLQL